MDGFAVCSSSTANASPKHPVRLRVVSIIAAGDKVDAEQELDGAKDGQTNSQATDICVEIMTGARFPRRTYPQLDAVVKVEDVARHEPDPWKRQGEAYIDILAHGRKNHNKRDAASDIVKGDPMIHAGQKIEPKHIMALTSLGFNEVNVAEDEAAPSQLDLRVLGLSAQWKIGVVSTGSELIDLNSLPTNGHSVDEYRAAEETLPNSNGPYICTALRKLDAHQRVLYLGVVRDTEAALEESFRNAILRQGVDVLITTGGVSMGKFALVKPVVENRMGGKVIFHGVKVRPGLPVIFAWVELDELNGATPRRRRTAVFGLPWNPLATAIALRFFVVPYLTVLRGELPLIRPIICTARFEQRGDAMHTISSGLERSSGTPRSRRKPEHLRVFWLARWWDVVDGHNGRLAVEILEEQSSYKAGNRVQADYWVEVPEGVQSISEGENVMAHPLSPVKNS
jgi:molybdopterin molybdotransferase